MLRRSLTCLGIVHRAWRYGRRVDPDEIAWMRSVLSPGDTVVDVGAYKGGYTYWMRRAVGPSGRVIAFEPQPELAVYLRRCVDAFGWRNVDVDDTALSSESGVQTLRRPPGKPTPAASLVGASLQPGSATVEVSVATLDERLEAHGASGRVDFLKCDVEGHELDVFRGARRTLTEHRPRILFECEARHLASGTMDDVFAHLHDLGYEGFFFWKGERRALETFDRAVHQVQGRKPYGNNFAFESVTSGRDA